MRGPPPLVRGGLPPLQQQQQQQQMQHQQQHHPRGRVTLSPVQRQQHHRQLQQQLVMQRQQLQQQQQQQNIMRVQRPPMLGRGGGAGMTLQIAGMKRPLQQGRMVGELPIKQPRLSAAPNMALQPGLIVAARLCRLCGLNGPYNFMLKDKPEILEALR